ncbi:hypothetical protein CL614_08330 [archaeon]|nr:hypothetical protein [archaeon]|tara:strand:- start:228 stop:422 length:195 start_codon:yes stop_codon:yes gene_type:complete
MFRVVITRTDDQDDTVFMSESRNDAIAYFNTLLQLMRKRKMKWKAVSLYDNSKRIQIGEGEING